MIETVQATIKRYHMLPRGTRVGVAVSGGADSVCLLHVLIALSRKYDWHLEVLHLNHKLRGAESDGDARFVAELADSLKLQSFIESDDVKSRGGNLEESARIARQEFFSRSRKVLGLGQIATGHTLDDQAETVLFRAVRGSGISGLQGILPVTREGIVRPLLDVQKRQIREWLQRKGLTWVEDATNFDTRLARNAIRHEILPWLTRAVNRRGEEALARLAYVAQEEEAYWRKTIEGMADTLFARAHGSVVLNLTELHQMGRAVYRRLVRHAIEEVTGGLYRVEFEHIESVLDLMTRHGGEGATHLPGVFAERSLHYLRISPWARTAAGGAYHSSEKEKVNSLTVTGPGEWQWTGCDAIRVEQMPVKTAILREWAHGDRIQLLADRPAQSLQDLFQKARIPRWERTSWPVLESSGEVVWTRRFGLSRDAGQAGWIVLEVAGDTERLPI